jgi:phospholipid/cholesterol/gamma-HCH transport system ATP-binding protein
MAADRAAEEEAAVRLEHVSKRFGANQVLDDVSFAIARGTAFCLLGRSGTGKSVTLKHIMGLMKPDRGHIYVEGQDITALTPRQLSEARRRIGFLFQSAALFDSISVGENVAFPLRRHMRAPGPEIRRRAREKLAQVGLDAEYDRMPAELSGGMRKRAGLARAMALDPPVLLVDEPSAGLDPMTTREIDTLLVDLKRHGGTTLLIVTHNMPSARLVGDELAIIHQGRIVARGTAAALDRHEDPLVRQFMESSNAG